MASVTSFARVWDRLRLPGPVETRIQAVLDSWVGTPYMSGQSMKGQGVDCVRFCCAVLDELYGYRRIAVPRLPPDTALHDPSRAEALVRSILESYRPNSQVTDGTIEPGDFLFSYASPTSGPGHGMLFGTDGRIWHANGSSGRKSHRLGCVKATGLSVMTRAQVKFEIWRLEDKHLWAR